MAHPQSDVTIADGTINFDGGVNSIKVATIQSQQNPGGLARNELAWLNNATVRDGGITQRAGWQNIGRILEGTSLYQGGFMYEPRGAFPYLIVSIGGTIWAIDPSIPLVPRNLSLEFGLSNPISEPHAYFCQAEEFLIIQAGDNVTLPLFWDGQFLRRSTGFSPTGIQPPTYQVTLQNVSVTPGTALSIGPLQNGSNPAGTTYVAPALAALVVVPIQSPYSGKVGDLIDYPVPATAAWNVISVVPAPPTPAFTRQITLQNVSAPPGSKILDNDVNRAALNVGIIPASTPLAPAIGATITFTVFQGITGFPPTSGAINLVYGGTAQMLVTVITNTAGTTNEIPAATAMDYFMGRVWYAQGKAVSAGDIVKGSSGTAQYDFRDSVLRCTENPLVLGGDGFAVPDNAGNVRALAHNANLDSALGQGRLFIFTAKAAYALNVPVTRLDWIGADNNNQPLMTVVLLSNGAVGDRSVVAVNGDLFFQSLEPSIRSLISAIRYFQQWGNVNISSNEQRVLQFNDRSLLSFSTGINFNNRLLQSALPKQLPQGVVHQAIIPLDFIPVSGFGAQRQPVWEGMYEGLDILQLFTGNFGGRERAFAIVVSRETSAFELWELSTNDRFENGDNRVTWQIETPAYTWGQEFALKKLHSAELWVDRMFGEVIFKVEWRPDGDPCWKTWHTWKQCSARNSCEDVANPICYPLTPFQESFRSTMSLPFPPDNCESITGRPANVGYQHQLRITIKGFCRLRGILLHAEVRDRNLYALKVC